MIPGFPGDRYKLPFYDVTSYPVAMGALVLAGQVCEVITQNGRPVVQSCQSTGQEIARLAGVALLVNPAYPAQWQAGEMVPVLRKGSIWALYSGGWGAADLTPARVLYSSTTGLQGYVTDAASSGVAGAEVSSPIGKFRGADNNSATALVELGLPAQVY